MREQGTFSMILGIGTLCPGTLILGLIGPIFAGRLQPLFYWGDYYYIICHVIYYVIHYVILWTFFIIRVMEMGSLYFPLVCQQYPINISLINSYFLASYQQKIQLIEHVPFILYFMTYQKQKVSSHSNSVISDSEEFEPPLDGGQKKKRIAKHQDRSQEDSQGLYTNLTKKKKEVAKEIKRIREQNRRASHKEYVTKLQQELKEKQSQIQKLTIRIKQLEQDLQAKICHKCGNDLTDVGNVSPLTFPLDPPNANTNIIEIEQMQEEEDSYDFDQSYRRIGDESGLRICFGNKNLLFFLVTMCCLTIGSIADNPEMFLEPIHPFMVKSQMRFLFAHQKLEHFNFFKTFRAQKQEDWGQKYYKHTTQPPTMDEQISRVSDFLDIKFLLSKLLPKSLSFLTNARSPAQMLLTIGTNQLFSRFLDARNYYL